jgi:hypothetical protein
MKQPWVWAALVFVAASGTAGAQDSDQVLFQLNADGRQVQVLPRGLAAGAFLIDPAQAVRADGRWQAGDRFAVDRDSIRIDGKAYGLDRFGRMDVGREGETVQIRVYERAAPALPGVRRSNLTAVAETLSVATGAFARGWVLGFGSHVSVEGEVNRSVVAIGGDVTVADGGVVRGSVVSIGGNVHKSDRATVYGDLYAGNRRRFRPRWFERTESNRLGFDVAFDYNRVTGALPWARLSVQPDPPAAPALHAAAGYAFESELWHYRVGIGRTPVKGPRYDLSAFRETQNDDGMRIGKNENLVFALLFREDYRDYYFAEGFEARGGWSFGRDRFVELGYCNARLDPLAAHPRLFSVFGGDPFKANYASLVAAGDPRLATDFDGRLASVSLSAGYRHPYFEVPADGFVDVGLEVEASHPDLDSRFDFTRYHATVRGERKLWRDQTLRLRTAAGATGGTLPALRYFYLGGISSLRGYPYKVFAGDRFWLLNAEYAWEVGSLELFALGDFGQAGFGPGFTDGPVRYDVGLGLAVEGTFRVQLAWAPAEEDSDPLVTVRFSRPF